MTKGRLALTALGIALSVLAVLALLRAVRAADVAEHLRETRLEWLAAGVLVTAFGYVLRAYRWRALLHPQRDLPISRVFGPTVVGFLAINTLPARLGEFVRAYLLARLERLPTAGILGSCALERVLDLAFLAVFWAISLPFAPYPEWFRVSGYLTFGIGGLAVAALWLFHARRAHAERSLEDGLLARLPARLKGAIKGAIPSFAEALTALGAPGVLPRALAWSAAMWVVNASVFLLIGYAVGLTLPWWSPFLLVFVVCVAISLPSSPGFIGVMEAACVAGLTLLGVNGAEGLAFGLVYHLSQILPLVLLGSVYALRAHLKPADLAPENP
ncbi:MAG TPA: lysylphosphatidylglycerol synthase transmembrane domain-containing protein [Candidatus Eisenbacteria bacterium]|nr:lysylphosphatidylglycerol synthase transmembrane domain-containing protein [Candidatus Eisenbacteria bacterium]